MSEPMIQRRTRSQSSSRPRLARGQYRSLLLNGLLGSPRRGCGTSTSKPWPRRKTCEEDMEDDFFDRNYRAGRDSGFGSLVSSTATYRYIIEPFIRLNDVHSVLDLGCGDWQFSKLIPWDNYDIS